MFIVIRKHNILLVLLVLLLAVSIFGLTYASGNTAPVSNIAYKPIKIMLDPGHGGEDPGAVSDYSGVREKDLNLDVAFKLKTLLEEFGYEVVMTRETDTLHYPDDTPGYTAKRREDLNNRKRMMDETDANIIVSIHMNKFGQTKYFGAQTFYPVKSNDSKKLADSIQNQIKQLVDPNNEREPQGTKQELIILKNNAKTICIVECGFLSNQEEEKLLQDSDYRQKIAQAIKAGIDDYFKE
ncbi:MAG TPA: cell wall hydrolase [Clostridiales bacterium]|nr:cell wall hydrolase [Clostridiales bacterium]